MRGLGEGVGGIMYERLISEEDDGMYEWGLLQCTRRGCYNM